MDLARPITLFVTLFVLAGLAEIRGGDLIWRWLREGGPVAHGDHPHLPAAGGVRPGRRRKGCRWCA